MEFIHDVSSSKSSNVVQDLQSLVQLKEKGFLTEEEFSAAKFKILKPEVGDISGGLSPCLPAPQMPLPYPRALDNWKLIENGDLPIGFQIVEINEDNFPEYAEIIWALTHKAINDGSIKIATKGKNNKNEKEMKKCREGHILTNSKRETSWFCNGCGNGKPPPSLVDIKRYRCQPCNYDLCEICYNSHGDKEEEQPKEEVKDDGGKMKKCREGHILTNSMHETSWFCNGCGNRKPPPNLVDIKRYRCQPCDYDLCEICYNSHEDKEEEKPKEEIKDNGGRDKEEEKPKEEVKDDGGNATILCDLCTLLNDGPTDEEKTEQAKKEEKMINDGIMIVKIDPPQYTIKENDEEKYHLVTIVRRGGDLNTQLQVDYKTVDGSACADRDLQIETCGTLCYMPGETEKKVDLQVKHDDIFRGDRHFYFHIIKVRRKDGRKIGEIETTNDAGDVIKVPSIQLGSANCATITILDDNHGGVFTFEKPEVEIDQSDGSVDLKILRKQGARGTVAIYYETEEGTARCDKDFECNKDEVYFKNNETEKIITINLHVGFYKEDVVMYVNIGSPWHIAAPGEGTNFSELDCKDPSELTKDERIALLGRPVLGDFPTVTIRIKESKRVQGPLAALNKLSSFLQL